MANGVREVNIVTQYESSRMKWKSWFAHDFERDAIECIEKQEASKAHDKPSFPFFYAQDPVVDQRH